jgi:hypothetical protein
VAWLWGWTRGCEKVTEAGSGHARVIRSPSLRSELHLEHSTGWIAAAGSQWEVTFQPTPEDMNDAIDV